MLRKQKTLFRVSRHGIPIDEYILPRRVNVGIQVHSETPGVVPQFEALEAAIYCGYGIREWLALDWDDRAVAVAQYRMHNIIESHVSDAINKAADRGKGTRNPANRR